MFFLLLQAVLPNASPKDHKNGIKDDHSEPIVMKDLIYTFTGKDTYGSGKDTSAYKDCDLEGSCNLPFNNIAICTTFDNTVRSSRYVDALNRMSEFVSWHLNSEMNCWLISAMLEIIEKDSSIPDESTFFILEDGTPVKKAQLLNMKHFKLQPFMVGLLHFILNERRGKNHLGAATLDLLGTKKKRKARIYTGDIGKKYISQISVALYEEPTSEAMAEGVLSVDTDDKKSDSELITDNLSHALGIFADVLAANQHQIAEQIRENRKKTGPSEDEPDTANDFEAEVVDDDMPSGAAPNTQTIYIQNQTNIENQTVNNFDLNNAHGITFNL